MPRLRAGLSSSLAVCVFLVWSGNVSAEEYEARIYKDEQGKTLSYRLLKPKDYDAQQKYPLVLFLHGAGERGADNEVQLKHCVRVFAKDENRAKYPCFVAVPQCPDKAKWTNVDWNKDAHTQPAQPAEPMRLALEMTAALQKEFSLDPQRLYVAGLSMGGFGAWDVIARFPDKFAAAVPICGGGDEKTAPLIAQIPIWAFHGAKDPVVKPARTRNMIEAIKKAGGAPKFTEYPDAGHDSWTQAFNDPALLEWMFAQKKK
jgi:predicted peptidase